MYVPFLETTTKTWKRSDHDCENSYVRSVELVDIKGIYLALLYLCFAVNYSTCIYHCYPCQCVCHTVSIRAIYVDNRY